MKRKRKIKKKIGIVLLLIVIAVVNSSRIKNEIIPQTSVEQQELQKEKKQAKKDYNEVSSVNQNKGTMEERLEELKRKDKRVEQILEKQDEYPEELLDMLSRNEEMIDFVLKYPENKGKTKGTTIGEIKENDIPFLLQWDSRWGYANYKDNILAVNGCGPTALAMVIAGLKKENTITPYKIAKFAEENGYYVEGVGTSWSLMTKGAAFFGIKSKELPLDENIIKRTLEKKEPIICAMGKGDFTLAGHFIVLTGIEKGKIKVQDPNSIARSQILWDYSRIAPQIKNLWTFSL